MLTDKIALLVSAYKGNDVVAARDAPLLLGNNVCIPKGRNREASKEQDHSGNLVANQEHEMMIGDELLLRRRCRTIRYNDCGCCGLCAFLVNSDKRIVDYFRYVLSSITAHSGKVGGWCECEVHSHRLQYFRHFLANGHFEPRNGHRYPACT